MTNESHSSNSSSAITRHGIGYLAKWDLEDLGKIMILFHKIRISSRVKDGGTNRRCLDYLYQNLHSCWNDHKPEDFEPLDVIQSHNKIVNDGMVRIAELVTGTVGINTSGTGSGLWTHIACGTGANPVAASDSHLYNEVARVGLGSDGFQSAAGSVMRFGGFFAPTLPSATIQEGAVFDDPQSGIMLFRTVYPSGITHTINNDFFTISHSIYQQSL